IGRRTHVRNTGSAFSQGAFSRYGYNSRSELTGSHRYIGTDTSDTGIPVDPETRIYTYDNIGNRKTAEEHTLFRTYTPNSLNQYDQIITGTQPEIPEYDDDGNMTAYEDRKYTYNAENRLIAVEPKNPADGDIKTEFVYDYMGRRVKKTVSVWNGSWTPETEKLFIYDGWNMISEITVPIPAGQPAEKYYVWGLDISQSLQG
ncbi:MAG: hypothetical protein GY710_10225, partial [Desulfobacteraceae bacterium]|nr:hypothetical protein [Desulfobacteraceae bacterium]